MVHTLDKLALMAENKIPASVSGIFALNSLNSVSATERQKAVGTSGSFTW